MLKARRIVRHDVVRSRDVLGHRAIAMFSLQCAVEETETRASTRDSGGAFLHARDGRSVVAPGNNGGVGCRVPRGDEIELGNHPSLF